MRAVAAARCAGARTLRIRELMRRDRLTEHWLCEYWSAAEARWALCDASRGDDLQFDSSNVGRDQFIPAGQLWLARRSKSTHATTPSSALEQPLANDVLRDLAALNKVEVQPWHCWGAMCRPGAPLTDEQRTLFDQLAALTLDPDRSFATLRDCYETDPRVRVPTTVFNSHYLYERNEPLYG